MKKTKNRQQKKARSQENSKKNVIVDGLFVFMPCKNIFNNILLLISLSSNQKVKSTSSKTI